MYNIFQHLYITINKDQAKFNYCHCCNGPTWPRSHIAQQVSISKLCSNWVCKL